MKLGTILSGAALCLLATGASGDGSVAAAVERAAVDAALVARGAELAAIGNCRSCHTRPGGMPYAGGLALSTPFGTIYSTNITPDADTGIGRWTSEEFLRAMHEGVDRGGRQLYPAFPYDHFARVADGDVAALYAFLMTRDPVAVKPPENRLRFPVGFRPAVAFWKALFFEPGVYRPDPQRSAVWNRGAYLVEGLAHCGACHTPRNALGAEDKRRDLGGGEQEQWHASALDETSPAPIAWSEDALYEYLRSGREQRHGTAAGPMAPVARNLAEAAPEDVRAIAVYVSMRMRGSATGTDVRAEAVLASARQRELAAASRATGGRDDGATVFAGACASCHGAAPASVAQPVALGLTTSLNAPDPGNALHIVLEGLWPEAGAQGPIMPGFAGELTDAQVAALVDYLRASLTDKPPWRDLATRVSEIRLEIASQP